MDPSPFRFSAVSRSRTFVLAAGAAATATVVAVGAFFSYNNAACQPLGRLIEVAAGTTYNAAMANLLFGPLALENSLLDPNVVRQRPFADGHVAVPINGRPAVAVQTPLWIPRSTDPAGGIW
jgi:CubicO group peptidase (beta-lactamase class C family)